MIPIPHKEYDYAVICRKKSGKWIAGDGWHAVFAKKPGGTQGYLWSLNSDRYSLFKFHIGETTSEREELGMALEEATGCPVAAWIVQILT